jgi:hypothetical protein
MPSELDRSKQRLAMLFLLAMTLLHCVVASFLFWYLPKGFQDFTMFYRGAEMVRAGQMAQWHDLHPAFEELLFVPLTYLDYFPAYEVWTFLNVVMLALCLGLLKTTFEEVGRLSPLILILSVSAFAPVVRALFQGQDSILLLLLVTLCVFSLARGHVVLAGAMLGLGMFKFHLVLPLALVLAVRRARLWLGFVPVTVVLAAIWTMMVGREGIADYAHFIVPEEAYIASGKRVGMANLHGLLAQLTGKSGGSFVKVAAIVCGATLLGVVLWKLWKRKAGIRLLFSVAIVTSILVGYHAIIHDLTLLLPVVLMLFAADGPATRSEMRVDIALLVVVYTTFFIGTWIWQWVNPWWWIPIAIWISRKYGRGDSAAAAA